MRTHRFLVAMLAFLTYGNISAATYFCSPNGSGNGSSSTTPCNFSQGLNKISQPGDTLYLLPGQYNLSETSFSKSGSTSRRIVLSGINGVNAQGSYDAILDFRGVGYGTRGLKISGNYVHVRNMVIRYSGKNNLYNSGSNNLFENLDIYGSADTGCQMKGGGNNIIKNVDSHDNFDYEHYGSSGADFGGNADGFADKQFTGDGNHYIGCRSWNNSDDGWDFFDRYSNSQTIIENCICYKNGPTEYDMRNHARYQTDKKWFDDINGTTITNRYGQEQVVTMEHYPNHGNGNGFKLGGNYSTHNVLIHHCLAVANTVRGFDQNNNGGEMRVYNNTGYQNGYNFGFSNTSVGLLRICNNLSYQGKSADGHQVQTVLADSHNTWNNHAAQRSDFVSLDTTQILAARQTNGDLPATTLLHLTSTSSMIDAGIVLNFVYYGTAPDLGCYEYITGDPINPDPGPEPGPEPEPEYECKEGATPVAYVTIADPISQADRPMLNDLRADTTLCVELVDVNETQVDYSGYDLVIISPVPSSASEGITPIKNVQKPRLVLKPWIYKNTVWNWATPGNTADDSFVITDASHPIFAGLTSPVKVFSRVTTNGITTAESWRISPVTTLGQTSDGKDVVTEYANVLTIGISEYSTAAITADGLHLVHNAVYYLLGRTTPAPIPTTTASHIENEKIVKIMTPNGVIIRRGNTLYTITGQRYE